MWFGVLRDRVLTNAWKVRLYDLFFDQREAGQRTTLSLRVGRVQVQSHRLLQASRTSYQAS
jgi:hypothetical protein